MQIDLESYIRCLATPEAKDELELSLSSWLWSDALEQDLWGIHIFPDNNQRLNIMRVAHKLEQIKKIFPTSEIEIASWLRCRPYNLLIGGAKNSWHIQGMAVDFSVKGIHASQVRARLSSELDRLKIRMERLPDNAPWIHIDIAEPKGQRYFYP